MPKLSASFYRHPGVYKITCIVTGKIYVGSASESILGRWGRHKTTLRGNYHDNSYLQRAWNKYGENNFRFNVIEFCASEIVLEREQFWLDKFQSYIREVGYNIGKSAVASFQGRNHSEETKKRWSEQRKGIIPEAATKAAALANRGRPVPQERRDRISKKHKGVKKSPEHVAKVKANHWSKGPRAKEIAAGFAAKLRGRKHPPEVVEKIRLTSTGRLHSEEAKKKIAESRRGTTWDPVNQKWIRPKPKGARK